MLNKFKKKIILNIQKKLPLNFYEKIISKKRGIIFLMYHSVRSEQNDYYYSIGKKEFEQQICFLSEHFKTLNMSDAYDILCQSQKCPNMPSVVITFDDVFKDNLEVAYPILKKYKLPFTIFITTNFVEADNKTYLSWPDIFKLSKDSLVTIGAHTKNHMNLKSLVNEDKIKEISEPKSIIESKIGKQVKYFAYPGGGYDEICLKTVEKEYVLGFKDRSSAYEHFDKRKLPRISIDKKHINFKLFLIELINADFLGAEVGSNC